MTLFVSVSDGDDRILVFQPDINARSIPGPPDAMRQIAGGNGGNQFRLFAATIDLHDVFPAHRHIGELAVGVVHKRDMVGDGAGIQRGENSEREASRSSPAFCRCL